MLMVLVMRLLLLKLNNAPASVAKDDPTRPSVALAGIPRPILYFTGWIDISKTRFGRDRF